MYELWYDTGESRGMNIIMTKIGTENYNITLQ